MPLLASRALARDACARCGHRGRRPSIAVPLQLKESFTKVLQARAHARHSDRNVAPESFNLLNCITPVVLHNICNPWIDICIGDVVNRQGGALEL